MTSDATSQWPSPVSKTTDSLRSQVVDVAAELMRGTSGTPGSGFGADAADQSAMNLYLALLMDRLPVYAHTMINLESQAGEGCVEQNLIPIGLATIQFYCEILAAKVTVLTKPDQVLQLRRGLRARDLGPQNGHQRVAAYLEEERRLGRVAADVDSEASAQLLIGACLNYAFTKALLDDVPPAESFVERAVRGLRLTP
jgi:hypothetical protein